MGKKTDVDGWENIITKVGTERDSRTHTKYKGNASIDRDTLEDLYETDGLSARIIDIPADEILKQGYHLTGDTKNSIKSYSQFAGLDSKIADAYRWSRLYGGALILIQVDDGGDLDKPVNISKIKEVKGIKIFDSIAVNRKKYLYSDLKNPKYGQTEYYSIQESTGDKETKIHETRCIEIHNRILPNRILKQAHNGWGSSYLNLCYESMRRLSNIWSGLEVTIQNFITDVLEIPDLGDILTAGNEAEIIKRIEVLDMSKHALNTMLIGSGETFTRVTSSISGFTDAVRDAMASVAGDARIPVRKLFGAQAGGLNNNGDGETTDYYDRLESDRQRIILPALYKICRYIAAAKDSGYKGDPDDIIVEMEPMETMTIMQKVETMNKQALTDQIYMTEAVVTPDEVRASRYSGRSYSYETKING